MKNNLEYRMKLSEMSPRGKIPRMGVAAALLSMICWNLWNFSMRFHERLSDGLRKVESGREFTCGMDDRFDLVNAIGKHVQPGEDIFIWFPGNMKTDPSVEASVGTLCYYFYPSRIHYLHNRDISGCDFIIAEEGVKSSVESLLRRMKLDKFFHSPHEESGYVVFQREK